MSKRREMKINNGEKPLIVAKKSVFAVLNFGWILQFVIAAALAVGAILVAINFEMPLFYAVTAAGALWILILLFKIVRNMTCRVYVYKNRVVTKKGIIFDHEATQELYVGITSIFVEQSTWGNLQNYGSVRMVCAGRPDMFIDYIVEPRAFARFMSKQFVKADSTRLVLHP